MLFSKREDEPSHHLEHLHQGPTCPISEFLSAVFARSAARRLRVADGQENLAMQDMLTMLTHGGLDWERNLQCAASAPRACKVQLIHASVI